METTVYVPNGDAVGGSEEEKSCCSFGRIKATLQHLGLLITLMGYTVAGGLVFRRLEHPAELSRLQYYNESINARRSDLLDIIANSTGDDLIVKLELTEYERLLEEAVLSGYPLFAVDDESVTEKWTFLKAVFFSSTVLTTIGYGNIVPTTTEGRAFCIVFALVGIPLTLTVIADWGRLFASSVSTLFRHISPLPSSMNGPVTTTHRTSLYALLAVGFLFVYLSAGAGLFVIWEEDWTFMDGFYFCFITMTTIGFGDLVPKKPKYMLLCTVYILVGLALTTTIIELVRRQYAQSWRQLQALRGPLAENFKRLAENAPGLDVAGFQHDLMKVLTVVTMPKRPTLSFGSKRGKDNLNQTEWENAIQAVMRDIKSSGGDQRRLQVVIYESSV